MRSGRGWLDCSWYVGCGYLEQVAYEVSRAYVKEKSGGYVRSFAHSWLERTRNPWPSTLTELTGRFDMTLSGELESFLNENDQLRWRELTYLVDRRNAIAHGLNEGINSAKAVQLKDVACDVADWFIAKLNPWR